MSAAKDQAMLAAARKLLHDGNDTKAAEAKLRGLFPEETELTCRFAVIGAQSESPPAPEPLSAPLGPAPIPKAPDRHTVVIPLHAKGMLLPADATGVALVPTNLCRHATLFGINTNGPLRNRGPDIPAENGSYHITNRSTDIRLRVHHLSTLFAAWASADSSSGLTAEGSTVLTGFTRKRLCQALGNKTYGGSAHRRIDQQLNDMRDACPVLVRERAEERVPLIESWSCDGQGVLTIVLGKFWSPADIREMKQLRLDEYRSTKGNRNKLTYLHVDAATRSHGSAELRASTLASRTTARALKPYQQRKLCHQAAEQLNGKRCSDLLKNDILYSRSLIAAVQPTADGKEVKLVVKTALTPLTAPPKPKPVSLPAVPLSVLAQQAGHPEAAANLSRLGI